MAEFRFCPGCGAELGDFKFCPQCGVDLSTFAAVDDGAKPSDATEPDAPTFIAESGTTHEMNTLDGTDSGPRTATKPGMGAQDVVAAVKARVAASPASDDDANAKRKAERAARTAKTVLQASITPEQIIEAQARAKARKAAKAEAEAAAAAQAPAEETGKRKRRSDKFSETQWFMKGVSLDAAAVTAEGSVEATDEEYILDESIPEEKRRKFTLRKDNED